MEFKQYLEALRTCKDISLWDEYGVYDNYDIGLQTIFQNLVDYFRCSDKWALRTKEGDIQERLSPNPRKLRTILEHKWTPYFNFTDGCAVSSLHSTPAMFYPHLEQFNPEEYQKLKEKIDKGNYSCSAMFHPAGHDDTRVTRAKGFEGQLIEVAKAIVDFSEVFIVKNRVPAVFLSSRGNKHFSEFLQTVFYEPK